MSTVNVHLKVSHHGHTKMRHLWALVKKLEGDEKIVAANSANIIGSPTRTCRTS